MSRAHDEVESEPELEAVASSGGHELEGRGIVEVVVMDKQRSSSRSTTASVMDRQKSELSEAEKRVERSESPLSDMGESSVQRKASQLVTDTITRVATGHISHERHFVIGEDGKEHHFFLSHKKWHSVDGLVPAQIALNMHDSLEMLGYRGWFDSDDLDEITTDAMYEGLSKSCAAIVLLNGETHLSQYCVMEWKLMAELGLPVVVVLDLERANKQKMLKEMAPYPNLLRFQWIEYTGQRRREAINKVVAFLEARTAERVESGSFDVQH